MAKTFRLAVLNRVIFQAPIWEPHFRGANWLAVIDVDPALPGGLSRQFMQKARGDGMYIIEQLGKNDPIEFGADYTTSVGTKKRNRWYGVVLSKTEDEFVIEEAETGAAAVLQSRSLRKAAG